MRRRILLLSLSLTTLVVLAFAIPLVFLIRSSVEQRALRSASDEASSVANFVTTQYPSDADITSYLTALNERSDRKTCVQTPDGTVLGEQPPGGVADGPPLGGKTGQSGGKYNDATFARTDGGQIALVDAESDGELFIVRTFVPDDSFDGTVHAWWIGLGGASLALILVSLLAAEIMSRRLVRPLVQTAATAHRISAGEVDARAPADGPVEVAEVGLALNQLADRISDLIAEERETVADLSHRLRTPLTALRLDVDALHDPADAQRLGEHVDSLERSLTAVIRAARRPRSAALVAACDATAVVAERVAFWAPLAEDQGRRMDVSLPVESLSVRSPAEDLAAAVDALLENVIAHTPEGTALAVRLRTGSPAVVLEVLDEGPGIPATAAIRGRSDRGSTGLGLSIARRCAESSGGELTIDTGPNGRGATVTLRLGAP